MKRTLLQNMTVISLIEDSMERLVRVTCLSFGTQRLMLFFGIRNIQNTRDQQRLVIPDNRQALANWIAEAMVSDYKKSK